MSVIITKNNGNVPMGVQELMADTVEDMENEDISYCLDGTICLVISTCDVYVLKDRQWKKLGGN